MPPAASLIGVSHLGETMQYLVRLGDDQSLIVRRPTPEAPGLAVGDAVVCTWNAESVLLFPADDAADRGRLRRAAHRSDPTPTDQPRTEETEMTTPATPSASSPARAPQG